MEAIGRAAHVPGIGGETFQIATAQETTVGELTEALIGALEAYGVERPDTRFGEKRNGDVVRRFNNTSKAQTYLDWQSRVPLVDGLRRTIRYFISTTAA